jgi:transformation/transcription domain-associated protein
VQASHGIAVNGIKRVDSEMSLHDAASEGAGDIIKRENSAAEVNGNQHVPTAHADASNSESAPGQHSAADVQPTLTARQGWEYVEEVVQILKTAFPLLILSMETMVDQILQRFKAPPEEEIYRLISMLLQDAIQVRALSSLLMQSVYIQSRTMWCARIPLRMTGSLHPTRSTI